MKTLSQFILESEGKTSEESHFAEHGFKRVEDREERDGSKTRRYEHPDGHKISVSNYTYTNRYAKAPYTVSHAEGISGGPRYNKASKDHITAIKSFKRMQADAAANPQ